MLFTKNKTPLLSCALLLAPACGDAGSSVDALAPEPIGCSDGQWPVDLPPLTIDGVEGRAIDVESLNAEVVFDPAAQKASVVANLSFQANVKGGPPIFDLRQTISTLYLDGEQIDLERVKTDHVGGTTGELRLLDADLEACSRHVLKFEYELSARDSLGAQTPTYADDQNVAWDFALSDTEVGRFLELWFPANLCHDEFSFTLDLTVKSDAEHTVITNGQQTLDASNEWSLTFPDDSVSHTPMLVLLPTQDVVSQSSQVDLPLSGTVELDLYTLRSSNIDLDLVEAQWKADMARFEASTGAYLYDRFTAYLHTERGGMEYDGGTVSSVSAMSHETHHSWYARGVRPLTQNDGWIDEAWTTYVVDEDHDGREPDRLGELLEWPRPLFSGDPWSRITVFESYFVGSYVFRWIALAIGHEALVSAMAEFYQQNAPGPITSAGLERHLHCTTKTSAVREVFHGLVWGREGSPGAVPTGYCD